MAGFYLFSHPSIIYRVWLITPSTLSSFFSTTDLPESCTLWHTFSRQVIWTPRQRRIASSCQVIFVERNRSTCSCSIYAHLYLWWHLRFSLFLFFWLELTDFLFCIVSFNSLWCSVKEVNSNFQLHVSVKDHFCWKLLFCCVFLLFCFVKWDRYWATNTLKHRKMYSHHM